MAGDAGRALPLGSGQSDVGRVDRSRPRRGGPGWHRHCQRPPEAGQTTGRRGKPLQLPAGTRIRHGLPARDCPKPEIFGAKREGGDGTRSPSQRSCCRSGGGGGPGVSSPLSPGFGATGRQRVQAFGPGGPSPAGSGQGVAGRENSAHGGGLGRRGADQEPGRGAGRQSGALHRGRVRCGPAYHVRKNGRSLGAWRGGAHGSGSRPVFPCATRASAGVCRPPQTSGGEPGRAGHAAEGGSRRCGRFTFGNRGRACGA